MTDALIRAISTPAEMARSVEVIREAFRDVAEEFGLTAANCPTHPSLQTLEGLVAMRERGAEMYGLFEGSDQVGFIAIERADPELCYMERLAVVPTRRHHGYGRTLVESAVRRVAALGGKRVSIGIIAQGEVLKKWYEDLGFVEVATKRFPSLPFEVCFLEIEGEGRSGGGEPEVR